MNTLRRANLSVQPEHGSLHDRIHNAIRALDKAGIYAVIGHRNYLTRGDAWCDLDTITPAGMRPAMGDREDGALCWSFPYDEPEVARAIVKAFKAQGFETSWNSKRTHGHYMNRVRVVLDGPR